jgi:hypothetical protein
MLAGSRGYVMAQYCGDVVDQLWGCVGLMVDTGGSALEMC